ncbi:nitrilase and fragile histidine triad fusion protein NitFhit isoform X2 [Hyalella azteca]|uniref:Nitrilase and fragile histidine triad fusion protein NitFhit isoform X2 n=1 Tax=Hyalella azteca TaxID=294128 RepID=A0A8B7NDE6_HYAAZ|nr:nitrilase and fragile histidine triad fusion protein NitFhit isoform X2 [Hyalella azteca]
MLKCNFRSSGSFNSSVQTRDVFSIIWRISRHNLRKLFSEAKEMDVQESTRCVIAVAQMTCTSNKEKNFEQLTGLVNQAVQQKAKMIFLPEGCDYIASTRKESLEMAEELTGSFVSRIQELAREKKVWLSLGGVHLKSSCEDEPRLSNTHLIVSCDGSLRGSYAKTHLFSNNIPGLAINEADYVKPGDELSAPVVTPAGNVGLAICYDVRFPELSQALRRLGAHVLTFPSAFTVATGRAHWHVLLRARAIECQSFVVAAAQCGQHNDRRSSYGHSLVINPWGEVLCEVAEGVGVATAEINLQELTKVRGEMPCLLHSRQDLAGVALAPHLQSPRLCHLERHLPPQCSLQFGHVQVSGEGVFLRSGLSFSCSNLYPRLPGHSLVCPVRVVGRLAQLTAGEVSDLAQLTVMTHRLLCAAHNVMHNEVAIQDGPLSGQTVEHVHVHLLPSPAGAGSLLSPDVPSVSQTPEAHRRSPEQHRAAMACAAAELRAVSASSPAVIYGAHDASFHIPQDLALNDDCRADGDNACLSSRHCVVYCVAGAWQRLHLVVLLRRRVSSLSEVLPSEASSLLGACHLLQQRVLQHLTPHASTSFIFRPPNQDFQSVHVHVLPWLVERQPSDGVYTFVSSYSVAVTQKERLLAAALQRVLQDDSSLDPLRALLGLPTD